MSRRRWYILRNPKTQQPEHVELTDQALGDRLKQGWTIIRTPPRELKTTHLRADRVAHKS